MTVLPSDYRALILGSIAGDPAADICVRCNGTGWVFVPDPILGDYLDAPCPLCAQPLRALA